MTHKRSITLWAVIVLTFAVTTSADAQFGNILNKAKKAIKEKVKEKSEAIKEKPACRGRGMDLYRCQRDRNGWLTPRSCRRQYIRDSR